MHTVVLNEYIRIIICLGEMHTFSIALKGDYDHCSCHDDETNNNEGEKANIE